MSHAVFSNVALVKSQRGLVAVALACTAMALGAMFQATFRSGGLLSNAGALQFRIALYPFLISLLLAWHFARSRTVRSRGMLRLAEGNLHFGESAHLPINRISEIVLWPTHKLGSVVSLHSTGEQTIQFVMEEAEIPRFISAISLEKEHIRYAYEIIAPSLTHFRRRIALMLIGVPAALFFGLSLTLLLKRVFLAPSAAIACTMLMLCLIPLIPVVSFAHATLIIGEEEIRIQWLWQKFLWPRKQYQATRWFVGERTFNFLPILVELEPQRSADEPIRFLVGTQKVVGMAGHPHRTTGRTAAAHAHSMTARLGASPEER